MSYAGQYDPEEGIAIVGMAGRFPGARSVDELWGNIVAGRESISRFTRDELEPSFREDMAARSDAGYVGARGVVDDVDCFDEAFFGFSPAEAALLDPQHRLFLQAAWEALENAGHDPAAFGGLIGVYAGGTANSYYLNNLLSRPDVTDRLGLLTTQMANQGHYIATRTAYKLDLHGPALNIHTACSTSLVAVCTAVQALQAFQCDMALAGGVSITLPQRRGYLYQEGSILSPDGHCRAFDAQAAGTVFGNGLGIVVLRRLREALEAGDTIYAVIKGAALNNDGHGKLSFTAPSVQGQTEVIAMAQALAGIDPQTIGYVEAHGTGTALGDPIEIAALTQAFRAGGARARGTCAIGSLKTQIGHLDAAAGVAGLIRATLAVQRGILPPSLHFHAPNPQLELERSPFRVNVTATPWPGGATPRRAGVSSFGVGGTNAHVVLEQAPVSSPGSSPGVGSLPGEQADADGPQLLVLSARDAQALERATDRLRGRLGEQLQAGGAAPRLADIAYTLQVGRHAFDHRRAWACKDFADAVAQMASAPAVRPARDRLEVAFLFPGQGSQQAGMGQALYASEPVFRAELDACVEVLRAELGADLREWLLPRGGQQEAAQQRLSQTALTQPALLVVQLALARLWSSWGIEPSAMFGHSVGEYAAACLGGTFSRDDALVLVARRARLMQQLPGGAMLAVRAPVEELRAELDLGVDLAARNAPALTVLSGPAEAVERVAARLDERRIGHRRLNTSHAFHSAMMEPIIPAFEALVQRTPRQAPRLPWISSLTGQPVTPEQAQSPAYWARQLREPVQAVDALSACLSSSMALLEVGPGDALTRLARQHPQRERSPAITASLPVVAAAGERTDERQNLLAAAGRLWCSGARLTWSSLHSARRHRVALPTYPFARHRHWVDPGPAAPIGAGAAATAATAAMPAASSAGAAPPAAATALLVPHATPDASIPAPSPPLAVRTPAIPTLPASTAGRLRQRLQTLFGDLAGVDPAAVEPSAGFVELGLDSLVLTQASQALQREFGVKVPMRLLLETCSSIEALEAHLAPQLPQQPEPGPAAAALPVNARSGAGGAAADAAMALGPGVHAGPAAARAADARSGTGGDAASAATSVAASVDSGPAAVPAPSALGAPQGTAPVTTPALVGGAPADWIELFGRQLAIMAQQLEMIRGSLVPARASLGAQGGSLPAARPAVPAVPQPGVPAGPGVPATAQPVSEGGKLSSATASAALEAGGAPPAGATAFGPYRPPVVAMPGATSPELEARLARFIERYAAHTAGSKRYTQAHRAHLADPRSVAGYRQAWKELVYPIVTVRSAGSRLWDVDGHEYIDLTNGFGMVLFGHNPPFVREAVQRQLDVGYEIGPQTALAGEVAQALCAMVGLERAAFCCTGSEAVMAAIRVARTVTARERIVIFEGAYHGIFDEVLVRPGRTGTGSDAPVPRAVPIAPGIPASMAQQVIVLPYGEASSLRTIKSLGTQIAAVLVEPVQSRRPELQPRDFLHELRRVTADTGSALVFDEVVTGFRVHPGGAQTVFGVRADIATYGKVVGGGLPIGVVAGSARFLDALDGGAWRFGDDSAPEVGVTFFAGTFVRHPLALAAARAVLLHLKHEGPGLQRELNLRTMRFVETLRRTIRSVGSPLQIEHFSSWFCFRWPLGLPWASLFFAALRLRGIHVWEGRPCFLTTAHSDDDLQQVIDAVREALLEMHGSGFLPPPQPPPEPAATAAEPPVAGARRGRDRDGREAWFMPDPQRPGKYLQILDGPIPHG